MTLEIVVTKALINFYLLIFCLSNENGLKIMAFIERHA